ncbi:hypothetical protein BDQ17DRAFT_1335848 [Cyathus striatus]|nr:hypothetical protein BDQ17DRAFT_1335848 [Cyathus striatus]
MFHAVLIVCRLNASIFNRTRFVLRIVVMTAALAALFSEHSYSARPSKSKCLHIFRLSFSVYVPLSYQLVLDFWGSALGTRSLGINSRKGNSEDAKVTRIIKFLTPIYDTG